jgi:hypothetical protein
VNNMQKTKTQIRKDCVKIAKMIVKHKANYKCEKCGADGRVKQMQGSHIYPEGRYTSMSADPDNILCLCAGCHMWSNDSWHENPLEATEWFHKTFPERHQRLKIDAQASKHCDIYFWKDKLVELKNEWIKLTN